MYNLKEFKKTPENGLALFAGNVSNSEGQSDLQLWSIEPPAPLISRLYLIPKTLITNLSMPTALNTFL